MGFLKCYWYRFSVSEHTGWLSRSHICADTKGSGPCAVRHPQNSVPAAKEKELCLMWCLPPGRRRGSPCGAGRQEETRCGGSLHHADHPRRGMPVELPVGIHPRDLAPRLDQERGERHSAVGVVCGLRCDFPLAQNSIPDVPNGLEIRLTDIINL